MKKNPSKTMEKIREKLGGKSGKIRKKYNFFHNFQIFDFSGKWANLHFGANIQSLYLNRNSSLRSQYFLAFFKLLEV